MVSCKRTVVLQPVGHMKTEASHMPLSCCMPGRSIACLCRSSNGKHDQPLLAVIGGHELAVHAQQWQAWPATAGCDGRAQFGCACRWPTHPPCATRASTSSCAPPPASWLPCIWLPARAFFLVTGFGSGAMHQSAIGHAVQSYQMVSSGWQAATSPRTWACISRSAANGPWAPRLSPVLWLAGGSWCPSP